MKEISPQPEFLKQKLGRDIFVPFGGTQMLGEMFILALRYIFRHYHQTNFVPTLVGDALLARITDLDRHMIERDINHIAGIFAQHGYRLGTFHDDSDKIMKLGSEFKRANYYAPREDLLKPDGEVIDILPLSYALK
ncbi:MAG TPA: hypothetical protein DCM27_00060 [Rhodospirillaceae bacterium]|nr:hypothetical protein [Rhodospirillaceae bacterium]